METLVVRHQIFVIIAVALLTLSVLIPVNETFAQRYNNNYQLMQQQQRQQQMMQQQRQAEANRRAMEQQRRQQEQMRREMQRQRQAAQQRQRQMQEQMRQRQQQALLQRQRMVERQKQSALKRQQNQQTQRSQSQNAQRQQNQLQQRLALQQQRKVKLRKDRLNRIKRERDRKNKNQKKKSHAQTLAALTASQTLRQNNTGANSYRPRATSKTPSQFKKQFQANQQKTRQLQQTLQLRKNVALKLQKAKLASAQLIRKAKLKAAKTAKNISQKTKQLAQKRFSQCKGGECKLRTGNCSFHGDTLVKTKDGYEPIKSLQVGEDWVWSRNEYTGEMDWKQVVALFLNNYPETVEVTVTNPETSTSQIIRSNRIHEYYVSDGNEGDTTFGTNQNGVWTQAQSLQENNLLITSSGHVTYVERVEILPQPMRAYNITVDELHTYFVKENQIASSVWVHNDCSKFSPDRARFAQKYYSEEFGLTGKFRGKTIDQVALMLKQGKLSLGDVKVDYIVRGKNQLLLNTRSAQALKRAGIPMSKWVVVNKTGVSEVERRLDNQLKRNRLTDKGVKKVKRKKYFENKR